MAKAVIAIPTFRRPAGLLKLLESLAQLNTTHAVEILVADNDATQREGLVLAERLRAGGYRWPITPIAVPARGISQVRNALIAACLEAGDADYLLMLDDDETAEAGWLDEMVRVQRKTEADIVGGRVDRLFEGERPKWVDGVSLLSNKTKPGRERVELIDSTANILFTLPLLARAQRPVFDDAFGLTGGGDKEALTRLKRAGASFAWAEAAAVCEQIPASRLTRDWVLKRAFRVGNSDMRVLLRHHRSKADVLAETLKALTVFAAAPVLLLPGIGDEARAIRARMMIWRAAGKLAAFGGLTYREYQITHGG